MQPESCSDVQWSQSYLEQGREESSLGHLVETYSDTVMKHLWGHKSDVQPASGLHLVLPI